MSDTSDGVEVKSTSVATGRIFGRSSTWGFDGPGEGDCDLAPFELSIPTT